VPGGAEDFSFQGCRFLSGELGIVTLGTSLDAPPGDYPADRERAGRLPADDGEWHLAASAGDGISIKMRVSARRRQLSGFERARVALGDGQRRRPRMRKRDEPARLGVQSRST
jgi:hypothetical protein